MAVKDSIKQEEKRGGLLTGPAPGSDNAYIYRLKTLPMQHLLDNVFWTFNGDEYGSVAEFKAALDDYATRLDRPVPVEEKIPLREIGIWLEWITADDEDEELEFTLQADNGEYFTSTELLFKVNNRVTSLLADLDHHFFEGLDLMDEGPPPVYDIRLGS